MTNVDLEILREKKIGLALSGGGFRAAFFHLGILSRLAELDMLSNIRAISTVSGGSIIGGLYYLELSRLIKSKEGKILNREDYINVVKIVEEKFINGVSKNIRGKVFLNPWYEIKSFINDREKTLSELYDQVFYKGENGNSVGMADLIDKNNVAPKLIINATSLINGLPWYFTPTEMFQYMDEEKKTYSYKENPIKLSDAVAASSTVPGLFNYFNIKSLDQKLVDGGVFDNLGISGLQKEDIDFYIISDASRPLDKEEFIPRRRLSVLKRSFDSSLIHNRNLMINSVKDKSLYISIEDTKSTEELLLGFGESLKYIRTDLNNFDPVEGNTLSYFGYQIIKGLIKTDENFVFNFQFKEIINKIQGNPDKVKRLLKSGSRLSRTGGNLIFAKDSKVEGIKELLREFKMSFIAGLIGFVYLFFFFKLGGFFKSYQWAKIGYVAFMIGYTLMIIFWVRKTIGESWNRKSDAVLFKIIHLLGILFIWFTLLIAFIILIFICLQVLNISI